MLEFKEVKYVDVVPRNIECLLVADIGGTNSNFGIFKFVNGKLELILSIHFKSRKIDKFVPVVKDVLSYLEKEYDIKIKKGGFAAAGVVKKNKVKPTNLTFVIDMNEILNKTGLTCSFLVNDFEVIGYGLDGIDQKDLVKINEGTALLHANKTIIGTGTGLGKCTLIWNKELERYMPSASEGGHADFSAQTQLELDLLTYIRKVEQRTCNISWEDVLSGDGIVRIYQFFMHRNGKNNGNKAPHPDEIFNARTRDKNSLNTFELYTKFYARCAKNFALDALALGGVYIAGGIAAKNLPLFELDAFKNEFINCGKQMELLKQVPIWVITDYNVSLHGAAAYMMIEKMCRNKKRDEKKSSLFC